MARFVNAASSRDIVFTRNATEAINLVANTWGTCNIQAGDEVRRKLDAVKPSHQKEPRAAAIVSVSSQLPLVSEIVYPLHASRCCTMIIVIQDARRLWHRPRTSHHAEHGAACAIYLAC